MEKQPTLTDSEVLRLFEARNIDLKLGFFDEMFMRFKEHCNRKCINRKIRLEDVRYLLLNLLVLFGTLNCSGDSIDTFS